MLTLVLALLIGSANKTHAAARTFLGFVPDNVEVEAVVPCPLEKLITATCVFTSKKEGHPQPSLLVYSVENGVPVEIFRHVTPHTRFLSLHRINASFLLATWDAGPKLSILVLQWKNGKLAPVLDTSSKLLPEVTGVNDIAGPTILINEGRWMPTGPEDRSFLPYETVVYRLKEGKYEKVKLVPYKDRFTP